jgi:hypothetical protein
MSQTTQIILTDLEEWLNRQTAPILQPLRSKGKNLLKEIQERLSDAMESNQKIIENSQREMEKNNPKTHRFARNANKFAQNLSKSMEATKVPEEVTYESLQTLHNDLERALVAADQLRREAYPYITPYFIFDRRRLDVTLKRLADISHELSNFMTTKYAKVKAAEHTSTIIDRLTEALNQANETKNEIDKVKQREKSIQAKLQETQQKIAQVQTNAELTNLMRAEEKVRELRDNVKHSLRYLQKPFFKLQSRARSGDVAIPLDEAKKLSEYLSDPFEALATEEEGYPALKGILRKLNEAIAHNKLKLKSTRLRKAQEQVDSVLNKDSLNNLHKSCMETLSQKNKMLASNAVRSLQNELTQLQNELRELQKENVFTTSRGKALENEHKKLQDRIGNLKSELEKIAFQLTNKNINVVFTQTK